MLLIGGDGDRLRGPCKRIRHSHETSEGKQYKS
jgi:hypothetical protein